MPANQSGITGTGAIQKGKIMDIEDPKIFEKERGKRREMKIIKVEGCSGCPYLYPRKDTDEPEKALCEKIMEKLDMIWSVNPYYSHPDCPLEEVEE